MPYRFVSEAEHKERAERSKKLAARGWSYRKIAAELGFDAKQVGSYLDAAGAERNARNGDVPAGKVSLNAIREQGGQHLDTIKKVLADHDVAIETVVLFDGRTVLLVDATALPSLRCSHAGCSRLATVESTGTCKRHSKRVTKCATCDAELSLTPSMVKRGTLALNFCSWSCRSTYAWHWGLASARALLNGSPKARRRWGGRWGGRTAGRLGGRTRGTTDKHVAAARKLKKLDPNIGRGRLAKQLTRVGLPTTEKQARALLAEIEG